MLLESQWLSSAELKLRETGIGLIHQLSRIPLPLAPAPLVRRNAVVQARCSGDLPARLRPNQFDDYRAAAERAVAQGRLARQTIGGLPQRLPSIELLFGCCLGSGSVQLHPAAAPLSERAMRTCKYGPRHTYSLAGESWYIDALVQQTQASNAGCWSPALAALAFTEFSCTLGHPWVSVRYDDLQARRHEFNAPLTGFRELLPDPLTNLLVTQMPASGWHRSGAFADFKYGTEGTITVLDARRARWAQSLIERSVPRPAARRERVLNVELAEAFPEGCHLFLAFCREGSSVENYQFGSGRVVMSNLSEFPVESGSEQ
jgi:hypothetical protein